METVTLTSGGQITIPMSILQKLGLREGSKLTVEERDNGVMIAAEPKEKISLYTPMYRAKTEGSFSVKYFLDTNICSFLQYTKRLTKGVGRGQCEER